MFGAAGILYNRESSRRAYQFVTRKISSTVAKIKFRRAKQLVLGNLDARRAWGYAPDYVRAMCAMLQQDAPGDYVVATGVTHTIRQFAQTAFSMQDLYYERYVTVNPRTLPPQRSGAPVRRCPPRAAGARLGAKQVLRATRGEHDALGPGRVAEKLMKTRSRFRKPPVS